MKTIDIQNIHRQVNRRLLTLLALCIGLPCTAAATDSANTPSTENRIAATDQVVMSGKRIAFLRTYRQMLDGLDAFDKFRELAPDSPPKFQLLHMHDRTFIEGLRLSIDSGDESIPVELAPDGTFVLPRIPNVEAELTVNRKFGSVRWRPFVSSPSVPVDQRRLGDLRMECRVFDAVDQRDMPFTKRLTMNLLGGACVGSRVDFWALAPRRITEATVVEGTRRVPLPPTAISPDGKTFIAPVNDTSWSNDARIEFTFAEAPIKPAQQSGASKPAADVESSGNVK